MAQRRQPFSPMGAMSGGGGAPAMGGGAPGPMMPKPPMTSAPAGNANPDAQNGSPMVPPPIDPQAGGPTAPGNIGKMLQTNLSGPTGQPQQAPQRRALPPWGDSQGDPTGRLPALATAAPSLFDHDFAAGNAFDPSSLNLKGRLDAGASGPMIMLKLLKSLGQLP